VLVYAYACEPDRGSEPGAGWGIVQTLARFAECTVLVGPEHSAGLLRRAQGNPEPRVTVVEVPEPHWGGSAKWHRVTWFLLYLEWLRRAARVARDLHLAAPFDLAYHATYSAYWLPSPVTRLGIPSVWGPVGGAVVTPLRLWAGLGVFGLADELLDLISVRLWETLPPTRRTWRDATVRIVQNETTLGRLPSPLRATTVVLNHAGLVEVHPRGRQAVGRDVLFLGRLERRKGVALAIRALPYARDVRLIVVGEGPARRSLQRLTRRLGVTDRVEFRGRILHAQVAQLLAAASAVVFPGLREEGGVALAEAMYAGVPVIVLAHGGARTIASDALDVSRVALIPASSTEEVARAIGEAMLRFCDSPPADNSPNLDPTYYRQALEAACRRALATRVAPHNAAARNDPVSQ
jgi:glycosyltransferase involved in cell wall biosynthesis